MHHVCKPKRMLTGLLAVALAALFVQAAAAYPMGQNDNTFAAVTASKSSSTVKAPLVIPYLSHGVGVDSSVYSGAAQATRPATRPDDRAGTLGIGTVVASQSQPTAVRPDDRAGLRGIGPFQVTKSTSSASSSTNWNAVLAFAGILLGVVLILAVAVGLTRRQHDRVLAH